MKPFFLKIASILTAFLVLFSTFSFTVEKHFCGEFLVDVSYFGEAEGCRMEMTDTSKTTPIKKKNCCKDEVHQIEGQDELQNFSSEQLSFDEQKIVAFAISYLLIFEETGFQKEFYKEFPPPDTYQDYQVLYQSFLI